MAGTNWVTARDGSRPEMDRARRLIAARKRLRPGMDCSRRGIAAGDGLQDGSRSEIDRSQIWISTGYGWMTGGG